MPVYEYCCADCGTRFSKLRPMSKADAPIACVHCQSENTGRVLSLFAAVSKSSSGESRSVTGSGCSSCAATSCHSCRAG
ncbi:MAG: zinc ribbon domain-containing protein [Anaerolineae bacterium]|nr:zinc ribbon domain-containing protein [Anaerolineae bacterium]